MLYFKTHHHADKFSGHSSQTPRRPRLRQVALLLGLLGIIFSLSSCVPLEEGPRIVTVSVEPSSIETNRYNGPMDNVSILIADFEGEIVEADVFIQLSPDPPKDAENDSFTAEGDTIVLNGIGKAWFQGLPADTYRIGARVVSDAGESIEQLDLATVTVTD